MKLLLSIFFMMLVSLPVFASYEDHFPSYLEYCTGTQWKLQNGEVGGSPGHGFNYVHGLCKDYRSSYPQVIPCNEVTTEMMEKFPHNGVGISLDKNFSNVMWVAVPGRDLTIFGDKKRQIITHNDVDQIIQKITDLKVFYDVIHKGEKARTLELNSPEYLEEVALQTLGTDYAVNWARELHCVRMPIPKSSLTKVAKFLNDSNNQYRTGPGYVWSKITNNCTHLSINLSNVIGINKPIKLDQKFIGKLTNLALPSNTFMMYADKAVLAKLPKNKKLTEKLKQNNFFHVQLGSIMENHPAFPTGDRFITDGLTVLTAPRILKPLKLFSTPEKYEKKYMSGKNTELKENAKFWYAKYENLIKNLSSQQKGTILESYFLGQKELAKKILETE